MATELRADEVPQMMMPMVEPDRSQPTAVPVSPPEHHTMVDAIRAFGVVVGPSIAFDLFTLGSIPAAILTLLKRPQSRSGRLLRPLAGLGAATLAAYVLAIRPWHLRWGATDDELTTSLPGDELQPDPGIEMTRAVTIDAPVDEVWPWLAQIGQDRGGFYSYEWLENLAGCRLRNAERIHPEWQQREMGETMLLHPAAGLKVALFEPNRVFAIENWGAYVLEPTPDHRGTRLIGRARTGRGREALFYAMCIEIPHFVMERKMLLGIKARAESARPRSAS